jgi:hypothetical protein
MCEQVRLKLNALAASDEQQAVLIGEVLFF